MGSVTMVAYLFPPEGNAGTYRPLRFVRQLSRIGWRTAVLTAAPSRYMRYDPDLLDLVPPETDVIRVPVRDPWLAIQAFRVRRAHAKLATGGEDVVRQLRSRHHTFLRTCVRKGVRRVEAMYYRPDMAVPWVRPAVTAGIELCRRRKTDVIWATIGPVSSGLVAQRVSRETGTPYVLDFRDPWGLDYYEFESMRPAWMKKRDRSVMADLLNQARAVIFLFDAMAESYCRTYREALDPAKIHVIPNGFEGPIQETREPGGICTVVYTGTLGSYRYDTLLYALRGLKQSAPELSQKLRFRFVGECPDEFPQTVEALALSDIVMVEPAVPHHRAAELQRSAHVLLLLGRDATRSAHELVAGAKLFEYLKARRPIFGVLPNDQGRRILHDAGVTTVCDVQSPEQIVTALQRVLRHWSAGTLQTLIPDRAACAAYTAESQTAALLRALEGTSGSVPLVSGAAEMHGQTDDHRHVTSESTAPAAG